MQWNYNVVLIHVGSFKKKGLFSLTKVFTISDYRVLYERNKFYSLVISNVVEENFLTNFRMLVKDKRVMHSWRNKKDDDYIIRIILMKQIYSRLYSKDNKYS